jgi:glycerol-3-phosphate acyltransferase PlsX
VSATVAVDALGGDRAPVEIVAGALLAASDAIRPVLYGPAGVDARGLDLVATPDVIRMHEKPAEAVRAKPESSLVRAVRAVADGEADAAVSAGNTGAVLAAAFLHLRRVPGVHRPAIAVVLPARRGPVVLVDAGANADSRPEHLVQFAHMGTVFAEEVLGIATPEVRLLSIGEEPGKGNQLVLDAHALLSEAPLRFGGNVEGRELLADPGDVVVADGFTGNVALKTVEGTIRAVLEGLREEIGRSARGRVGAALVRPAARGLRARLDPETYGGAYLLGLRGLVVIAHGASSRTAIANAVRLAARGVEHDLAATLAERLPARVSISS